MTSLNIAVVGAGLFGLCAARYAANNGHHVVLFEQTAQLGGTWYYTDNIGTDKFGLDIHTSMYHDLRTNLPKEIMTFADFPVLYSSRSYIYANEFLTYLQSYAEHYDLIKLIRYRHQVINVRPIDGCNKTRWEVTVKKLLQSSEASIIFDAVFICNGHNFLPNIPTFIGLTQFEGNKIHSHDYRRPGVFKDKTVLIIGGSTSGIDLTYAISATAAKVIFSHHTHDQRNVFAKNVIKKGTIQKFTSSAAIFEDGSMETITDVLFCTGFEASIPFVSAESGICVEDNHISPLFKHCINIKNPTMAFIGYPCVAAITQIVDMQVRFCMQYLDGTGQLPTEQEMLQDTERDIGKRFSLGWPMKKAHCLTGHFQGDYLEDLANTANIPKIPEVYLKIYADSGQRRSNNPIKYRDDVYRIVGNGFERTSLSSQEFYKSD